MGGEGNMSSINEYESSNLASFIYGGEMEIVLIYGTSMGADWNSM